MLIFFFRMLSIVKKSWVNPIECTALILLPCKICKQLSFRKMYYEFSTEMKKSSIGYCWIWLEKFFGKCVNSFENNSVWIRNCARKCRTAVCGLWAYGYGNMEVIIVLKENQWNSTLLNLNPFEVNQKK